MIKTTLHNVYRGIKIKVSPCRRDDKRFLIPRTTKILSSGHYDITLHNTDPQANIQLTLNAIDCVNHNLSGIDEIVDDISSYRNYLLLNENNQLFILI